MTKKSYTIESAPEESINQLIYGLAQNFKTETKFTPGPWKAIPDIGTRIPDKIYRVVGPSEVVCGDDGICTHDHYNDRSFEEDRANMHLIATAPELYEAAEDMLEELKYLGKENTPAYKKYTALLAKARGEAK